MRIGIFGGTFNPPHNGHLRLAKTFLEQASVDEVWLMVSPQNPFKVGEDSPADEIRLEMVNLALQGENRIKASDFEFHLPKPSYTWNTLQELSKCYPKNEFVLLIGGDNWGAFNRWSHHEEILQNYSVVVYPRATDKIDPGSLPSNVKLLSVGNINVSSTEIRNLLRKNVSAKDLLPPSVAEYLSDNPIYR